MMDELELLKKDWQRKEVNLPKLSYDEIYRMTWKKSSSIVKWILIISILEITLPQLLFLLPSVRHSISSNTAFNTGYILLSVFYYLVVLYFIYLFYKRYKEISVLDNAKSLMKKIIVARKTVLYYIVFSLSMLFLIFLYYAIGLYISDEALKSIDGVERLLDKKPLEDVRNAMFLAFSLSGLLVTAIMGGIYFLLYGLLLRKLKGNYEELQRLEI